jgi:quercetin dioxygenase-like cupin family protein
MISVNVLELELAEGWVDDEPDIRGAFDFPIQAAVGAAASSVIYFEVEPGKRIPRHTHTAEEILFVAAGTGEGEVGEERASLSAGDLVLVPAHKPHLVRNTGHETLRIVGFFASAAVITTLDDTVMPMDTRVLVTPFPDYALTPA